MNKDLFSALAAEYARFRPHYPPELYDVLFSHCPAFERAWDAGTGNGQVATALAERFRHVDATDISQAQLTQAPAHARITYTCCDAAHTPFPDHCFDLIAIAQALHWFELPAFFTETQRVAKPGALLAAWTYNLPRSGTPVDELIDRFYTQTLGPYWDPERKMVESGYASIIFPFVQELPAPPLDIHVRWSLTQLAGYLSSWSALQHFEQDQGFSPLPGLLDELSACWPGSTLLEFRFPISLRAGHLY